MPTVTLGINQSYNSGIKAIPYNVYFKPWVFRPIRTDNDEFRAEGLAQFLSIRPQSEEYPGDCVQILMSALRQLLARQAENLIKGYTQKYTQTVFRVVATKGFGYLLEPISEIVPNRYDLVAPDQLSLFGRVRYTGMTRWRESFMVKDEDRETREPIFRSYKFYFRQVRKVKQCESLMVTLNREIPLTQRKEAIDLATRRAALTQAQKDVEDRANLPALENDERERQTREMVRDQRELATELERAQPQNQIRALRTPTFFQSELEENLPRRVARQAQQPRQSGRTRAPPRRLDIYDTRTD